MNLENLSHTHLSLYGLLNARLNGLLNVLAQGNDLGMDSRETWKSHEFRQNVATKLDEAIRRSNILTKKSAEEMEKCIFEEAKNQEQYFGFLTRLMFRIRQHGYGYSEESIGPTLWDTEPSIVDPLSEILVSHGNRHLHKSSMKFASSLEGDSCNKPEPSLSGGSILSPFGRSKEAEKYVGNYMWKIPAFRKMVMGKIDAVLQRHGTATMRTIINIEMKIFEKSKSQAEYLGYVNSLLKHLQEAPRVCSGDEYKDSVSGIEEPVMTALKALRSGGMTSGFSQPPVSLYSSWRSTRQIVLGG